MQIHIRKVNRMSDVTAREVTLQEPILENSQSDIAIAGPNTRGQIARGRKTKGHKNQS